MHAGLRSIAERPTDSVKRVLALVIAPDALLASDAGRYHRPAAAVLGRLARASPAPPAERVCGALHIQTATSRHSQIRDQASRQLP